MKSIMICFFLSFAFFAQAQKGTTTFSVSYGDGKGIYKPILAKAEMLGTYTKGPIRTFDLSLVGAISKIASLEIGTSLLNHQYQFTEFTALGNLVTESRSINTLVFPIKLRFDILKYFFISGGFMLHTDVGEHGSDLDFGVGIGVGVQYYFKNKYGVFIYLQRNIHRLTVGLVEEHVAFGLAYRFQ
ncbi:MAG TPA: hypothetical protein VL088_06035 [Pedobacter sp.]|nr:hypothetical protein [Pedobacter sp.]